jgi:hypothetical protein
VDCKILIKYEIKVVRTRPRAIKSISIIEPYIFSELFSSVVSISNLGVEEGVVSSEASGSAK